MSRDNENFETVYNFVLEIPVQITLLTLPFELLRAKICSDLHISSLEVLTLIQNSVQVVTQV